MSNIEEDYAIFDDLSTYETYEEIVKISYKNEDNAYFCDRISTKSHRKSEIIAICRKFVTFFNILNDNHKDYGSDHISYRYPEFLNYWLKHQLIENNIDKDNHFELYNSLKNNYNAFDLKKILRKKIFDIQEYFNNINTLYLLYKKYVDIIDKQSNECNEFIKNCKENYNKALEKCFQGGDDKLCKGLKAFNIFYENNKSNILSDCPEINLPTLTKFILLRSGSENKSENQNIVYNLVKNNANYFYNGLRTIEHRNYPNLTKLLSYQYNILFEHDAKENKNNMMNILQQFLQYCDDNRKNAKLSSFMKEFIAQYYNKKQKEYINIFNECDNVTDSEKTYCQWYKTCKENFQNYLSLIKSKPESYIEEKVKYINNLPAFDLFIMKAKAIFQDFGAMSRYTPTITSTMVAVILCLFFLYKLAPFSPIFPKKKKRRKIPLFFPERTINNVNDHNSGHINAKPKRGKIRFSYQPS